MKFILVLLGFFAPVILYAQTEETSWVYENNMQDSSEHYVFGDTVFVRSASSLRSPILDTLFVGHEVLLLKKTGINAVVRGFSAPWVSVRYKKNGISHSGFIWSGLLSFNPMRRGTTKFIFGFDNRWKDPKNEGLYFFTGMLKVLENGKIVERISYKLHDGESLSYIEGKVLEPGGMENAKYIVDLLFTGEACGVDAYNHSFVWTGKKLVAMPLLVNVGDADVYWHTEQFIFPQDKGGQPKTLIIDIETGEQTEKLDKNRDYLYSFQGEKKYYSWDGTGFTLVKTVPKKKELKSVAH